MIAGNRTCYKISHNLNIFFLHSQILLTPQGSMPRDEAIQISPSKLIQNVQPSIQATIRRNEGRAGKERQVSGEYDICPRNGQVAFLWSVRLLDSGQHHTSLRSTQGHRSRECQGGGSELKIGQVCQQVLVPYQVLFKGCSL